MHGYGDRYTMKVQTSRFGEIELPDETVIRFPEGVVGFEDAKNWVMFDCGDEGLFKWLQSCDRPDVAFVICDASVILPQYQIMIGEKERALLDLDDLSDGVVCLILTIPDDPREATANLLGPIVMNSEKRLGMQIVLVNPEYSTRFRIFAENASDGGEETKDASA